MKEKVENIQIAIVDKRGIIRLSTKERYLDVQSLDHAALINLARFLRIRKKETPSTGDQERMGLVPALVQLIPKDKVKELYINGFDEETGGILAELDVDGVKQKVSPIAGLFIAKIFDAPIYLESEVCEKVAAVQGSDDDLVLPS